MQLAGIDERYIELSHGKTRYFAAGTGEPVILLHGAGWNSGGDSWLGNIGPLAERFRVLAPDCLGWGPGDQLALGYSFAYLVDFVREFQDALGLAKTHVVGHSMGGWIASLLAYESPQRIDRLVLVASGGVATRPLASMTNWQPPSEAEIRNGLAGLQRVGVDVEPLVQDRLARTKEPERVQRFGQIMAHMTNPETRQRYNTARRLPYITNPTLIIWGRDDKVNELEMGETMHRLIPGSQLVVFDGCGHGVPTEARDRFDQVVTEFLLGRPVAATETVAAGGRSA
jgi:pimeloyl-ACP methyl ester carboxylesterase